MEFSAFKLIIKRLVYFNQVCEQILPDPVVERLIMD